jgi:hypothetical protein
MTQRAGVPVSITTSAAVTEVAIPAGAKYLHVCAIEDPILFMTGAASDPPTASNMMGVNRLQPLVVKVDGSGSYYYTDPPTTASNLAVITPLAAPGIGLSPFPPMQIHGSLSGNIAAAFDAALSDPPGDAGDAILVTCLSVSDLLVHMDAAAATPADYQVMAPIGSSTLLKHRGHEYIHLTPIGANVDLSFANVQCALSGCA